ncbi:MAG: CocE/NonD family hydrolase [Thiohalomonadales bacterium]
MRKSKFLSNILGGGIIIFLSACASYIYTPLHEQPIFARQALSSSSEQLFDYPRIAPIITNHSDPDDPDLVYTLHQISLPSVSDNGQDDNLVSARFYQHKGHAKKPLVIILPLWGSYTYPTDVITDDLIDAVPSRHVLRVLGKNFMLDWGAASRAKTPAQFKQEVSNMSLRFSTHVTDVRRLIDWAETQPSIDAKRIALIGFSHGALVAALVAAVEPRLQATISVMGGTNIHQILTYCSLERTNTMRESITQRFDWGEADYQQVLEDRLKPLDLVNFQHRVNPEKVLIIESYYDDCIPAKSRDDLWKYMGYPQKISYKYSHKKAFLSMTILGAFSMRDKIYAFLDKQL